MIDKPHAIEEAFEGSEVIYSAYADGQFINRDPAHWTGNAMVATELAGLALSEATLKKGPAGNRYMVFCDARRP